MKDILELVSRLKQDKYKFTFDGEDMFEFPFGTLKISMFIEYDDDSEFNFDYPIYSDTVLKNIRKRVYLIILSF